MRGDLLLPCILIETVYAGYLFNKVKMIKAAYILLLFGIFYQVNLNFGDSLEDVKQLLPNDLFEIPSSIVVVILVRNKAHVLPMFLTYFEQLDYPKERISLWYAVE